jgi:hypothetical protein
MQLPGLLHTLELLETSFVRLMSGAENHHHGTVLLISTLHKKLVLGKFIWNL